MRAPSLLPAMPSLTVLLLGFGLALEEVTTSLRKAHQLAIVTLLSRLPCLLPWFFPKGLGSFILLLLWLLCLVLTPVGLWEILPQLERPQVYGHNCWVCVSLLLLHAQL